MSRIKVVLSGLLYPFTILSYFWRAFERREDVDLFVAGPYFDDQIPWNGGMSLPRQYVKIPHQALPPATSRAKLPAAVIQPPWKPDLWLQIDAGWHLGTKPDAGIVGHVLSDPHVIRGHYRGGRVYMDKVWCMQTPYIEPGEIYLPYAYDPTLHYPEEREKIYDACLIGLHYEHRDRLVARLRSRGLNVYYSIGEVYDAYRERYCQSKIALSWSSMLDLPARCLEAFGMGLPLVTNHVPDLGTLGYVDHKHYYGFGTVDEAEKAVMTLLTDPERMQAVARAGHEHARNDTWDARVEKILKDSGLL